MVHSTAKSRIGTQDSHGLRLRPQFVQCIGDRRGLGTSNDIQIEEIFEWRAAQRPALDFCKIDATLCERTERVV